MADLIETLFANTTVVEEIPVDEDAIYKQHYMSLCERIQACKTATSAQAENEALKANIESKRMLFITAPVDDSEDNFFYDVSDVKIVEDHQIGEDTYRCVLPTASKAHAWYEGLERYQRHLNERLEDLSHYDGTIKESCAKVEPAIASIKLSRSQKTADINRIRMLMLRTLMLEKILKNRLALFAEQCSSLQVRPDLITDGLWVNASKREETHVRPRIVLPVSRKYRLDAKSVNLIVEMCFSKDPAIRASAKLDLTAKLNDDANTMLKADAEKLLAIAINEAGLEPLEIAATLFPAIRSGEHQCRSCMTVVNIKTVIFHRLCPTVTWMAKYQSFTYSKDDQALVPSRRTYIEPESRYRISTLLRLHDQLNNDIVVRNEKGTTIWKRKENGVLERQMICTKREEDIVGTAAWRSKHGFSPRR